MFLNTVYFRRGLTCTIRLANALIDGGQLRAKPHLCQVKPNHVLKNVFSLGWKPSIKLLANLIVHIRPRLK